MQHSFRAFVISLTLLWATLLPLCAQQMRFDRFTSREGLPSNETFSLLQDRKGYIWICTNYGMVKYNGSVFQPVCTNIPFSEQFAYCMYEHPVHGLFFANSHANVYRIKNDSAFRISGFENVSKGLDAKVHEVSRLYVDDSLNIFIFSKGKSFKLQSKKGYKEINLDSAYVPARTDFALLEVNGNYFPLVDKYGQEPGKVSFRVIGKHRSISYSMACKSRGNKPRLGMKTAKGLYFCKENLLIRLYPNGTYDTTQLPGDIISISADAENNVWVGCYNKGLFKIDQAGNIVRHFFEGVSVNFILFDNQDGLWVSSTGKGLYHSRNIYNKSYMNIPGLDQRILLLKTLDSTLYISTSANRLFRIKEDVTAEIILPSSTLYEITDIVSSPGGYLISTKGTVFESDKQFKQIRPVCMIAPTYGLEKGTKDYYYMNRIGIGLLEGCKAAILAPSRVNHFIHYRQDEFLVASENGLYLIKDSIVTIPAFLSHFENIPVKRLRRSPDGRIWICTKGSGMFFIDSNGKTVACASPGKIVNDVCFPGDTMITVCCNNGTYITHLRNVTRKNTWLPLYKSESLTVAYHDSLLYLGTEDGLMSLNPKFFYGNLKAPFYLVKIRAGGKVLTSLPKAFLYDQNSPEFIFDYLDYKDIDRRIHYALTGAENRKGFTEGMKLRLENLDAGSYVLTVSPPGKGGKNITLRFTVNAPYWEKWWFITLIVTGIVGLITGIALLLYSRARAKAHKKTELSRMLAEYKLTALKAQINPHFMSNSLAAIQMLVIMNETEKAAQYLSKFSLFIRKVLNYSDKSFVSLLEETAIIDLYIGLEMLRFEEAFEFRKVIDPSIDLQSTLVPPLILQPFVENAIWHGLLPLRKKRKPVLSLSISRQANVLNIIIEDNGVGRKSSRLKEKNGHTSQGNQIMQKRLEHINLLLGISSARLHVEDLEDDDKNSSGTRVIITLPYNVNQQHNEQLSIPADAQHTFS